MERNHQNALRLRQMDLKDRLVLIQQFLTSAIPDFPELGEGFTHPSSVKSQNPFDGTPALPGVIYKSNFINQ